MKWLILLVILCTCVTALNAIEYSKDDCDIVTTAIGANNSCILFVDRTVACWHTGNTSSEETLFLSEKYACTVSVDESISCSGDYNSLPATRSQCKACNLTITYPLQDNYIDGTQLISLNATQPGTMRLTMDYQSNQTLCTNCTSYRIQRDFATGTHVLRAWLECAEGIGSTERVITIRQSADRDVDIAYWSGVAPFRKYTTGSAKIIYLKDCAQMRKKSFTSKKKKTCTVIKLYAKNLPYLNSNDAYTVWAYKSDNLRFKRLGNLVMTSQNNHNNTYNTGNEGFFNNQKNVFNESLIMQYDGIVIDRAPRSYGLQYPSTDYVLYFNATPPTGFARDGAICIHDSVCSSGICGEDYECTPDVKEKG